jgi:hypothetical protein
MNEKQPSQSGREPPAALGAQPAPLPFLLDRRRQAFWGGMLAGISIGIGLAIVLHVTQEGSPNGGYPPCAGDGCPGYSIGGTVLLVLFLGLMTGLGLGIGFAAAVPDRTADSAAPRHATPADQPPAPSV